MNQHMTDRDAWERNLFQAIDQNHRSAVVRANQHSSVCFRRRTNSIQKLGCLVFYAAAIAACVLTAMDQISPLFLPVPVVGFFLTGWAVVKEA